MSKRELGRVEALARVRSKQLRLVDAARLMRVCYRQAKRLWRRYREEGAAGLKHRSAGRPSHHAHEQKFRRNVLRLVRAKYGGPVGERFGPTLAAEHLASEDGLQVDAETLRRWMLAEGLWSRERKRRQHRRRRERKEHFGSTARMLTNTTQRRRTMHRRKSCKLSLKVQTMRNRPAVLVLLLFVLAGSACSHKPKLAFPLVQKYTTTAGDLFYFRPRNGQFVLLERRKALAVAVAPEPDIDAYSFDDRITVTRSEGSERYNRPFVQEVGPQQTLAITPDGRILAGGDAKGAVTLWEIASGGVTLHLDMPSAILSLAFSHDGNWLAIGLAKPAGEPTDTVWLYEIHANGPHRSYGRTAVQALAWSQDGRWLAAGLDDGSVLLSEAGGSEPRRIVLSTSPVTSLDFHPSGQFLASAHADKRVLLSKLPTGEQLFTFEPALPPNSLFPRVIERVAFDGNGTRLAAAYAEGDFRIWDTSALAQ